MQAISNLVWHVYNTCQILCINDTRGITFYNIHGIRKIQLSDVRPCEKIVDLVSENDEEQPSSPSVKKSEEKGVVVVHEVKCKLYVKVCSPSL